MISQYVMLSHRTIGNIFFFSWRKLCLWKYSIYECTLTINKEARIRKITPASNLLTWTSSGAQHTHSKREQLPGKLFLSMGSFPWQALCTGIPNPEYGVWVVRSNLSSSILHRVLLNTLVQQAGHDLPFLQVSKHTLPLFYSWEQANDGARGCQCLVAVLAAKWGLYCCLCCHRGHPKPRAKHVTASPWAHPKQRG